MCEIEWDSDHGDTVGRKPFVGQVAWRMKGDAMLFQFIVELLDFVGKWRVLDSEAEVAYAQFEKVIIGEILPLSG